MTDLMSNQHQKPRWMLSPSEAVSTRDGQHQRISRDIAVLNNEILSSEEFCELTLDFEIDHNAVMCM